MVALAVAIVRREKGTDDLSPIVDTRRQKHRGLCGAGAGKIDHDEGAVVEKEGVDSSLSTHDLSPIVDVRETVAGQPRDGAVVQEEGTSRILTDNLGAVVEPKDTYRVGETFIDEGSAHAMIQQVGRGI